jgi:hypothetical protein
MFARRWCYPHPLPLPLPPHHRLVAPWPPVPLLWLVVASLCLHCGIDVCGCIIIVCIVACCLGGGVNVCVFIHHLHHHPSLALRRQFPLLAPLHCCVCHRLSSALGQHPLGLHCCCCLHHGSVVCIVVCVIVCNVIVCVAINCAIFICFTRLVPPPPLCLPYPHHCHCYRHLVVPWPPVSLFQLFKASIHS